jgi:hypothetical protein
MMVEASGVRVRSANRRVPRSTRPEQPKPRLSPEVIRSSGASSMAKITVLRPERAKLLAS